MALSFIRPEGEDPAPRYIAPSRLWLTRDGRVVEDGDLDAQQLLIRAGGTMPLADAIRYGLVAPQPEQPQREQAGQPAEVPEGEPQAEERQHEDLAASFRPAPEV